MSISRNFLVMGAIYLLVGICFGMYMGASEDHTLAPVHAHINLLGFTLMTVFGLAYRVMPQMAEGSLAKAHFWLHQVGAFMLLVGLFLLMSGKAVPRHSGTDPAAGRGSCAAECGDLAGERDPPRLRLCRIPLLRPGPGQHHLAA